MEDRMDEWIDGQMLTFDFCPQENYVTRKLNWSGVSPANSRPVKPSSAYVTFREYQPYVSQTFCCARDIVMNKTCARATARTWSFITKESVRALYWTTVRPLICSFFFLSRDVDPRGKGNWLSELSGSQLLHNEAKSLPIGVPAQRCFTACSHFYGSSSSLYSARLLVRRAPGSPFLTRSPWFYWLARWLTSFVTGAVTWKLRCVAEARDWSVWFLGRRG